MAWTTMQNTLTPQSTVHFSDGSRCAPYTAIGDITPFTGGLVAVPSQKDVAALMGAGYSIIAPFNPPPRGPQAMPAFADGLFTDSTGRTLTYVAILPTSWRMYAPGSPATTHPNVTYIVSATNLTTDSNSIATVPAAVAVAALIAGWTGVAPYWAPMTSPQGAAAAGQVFTFPDGSSCTADSLGRIAVPMQQVPQYRSAGWTFVNGALLEGLI